MVCVVIVVDFGLHILSMVLKTNNLLIQLSILTPKIWLMKVLLHIKVVFLDDVAEILQERGAVIIFIN